MNWHCNFQNAGVFFRDHANTPTIERKNPASVTNYERHEHWNTSIEKCDQQIMHQSSNVFKHQWKIRLKCRPHADHWHIEQTEMRVLSGCKERMFFDLAISFSSSTRMTSKTVRRQKTWNIYFEWRLTVEQRLGWLHRAILTEKISLELICSVNVTVRNSLDCGFPLCYHKHWSLMFKRSRAASKNLLFESKVRVLLQSLCCISPQHQLRSPKVHGIQTTVGWSLCQDSQINKLQSASWYFDFAFRKSNPL